MIIFYAYIFGWIFSSNYRDYCFKKIISLPISINYIITMRSSPRLTRIYICRNCCNIIISYYTAIRSSKITINPDGVSGPEIPFLFSKPLLSLGDSAFFLINENDTSLIYPDLITPRQINIFPANGWKEKLSLIHI